MENTDLRAKPVGISRGSLASPPNFVKKAGKWPERPCSGKMTFRLAPETHARAALAAQLRDMSLNQWAEEVLAEAAAQVT